MPYSPTMHTARQALSSAATVISSACKRLRASIANERAFFQQLTLILDDGWRMVHLPRTGSAIDVTYATAGSTVPSSYFPVRYDAADAASPLRVGVSSECAEPATLWVLVGSVSSGDVYARLPSILLRDSCSPHSRKLDEARRTLFCHKLFAGVRELPAAVHETTRQMLISRSCARKHPTAPARSWRTCLAIASAYV